MVRVIFYLFLACLLALAAVWLADRPGEVAVVWQGYRIETSLMVLTIAILFVIVLVVMIWSLIRAILRSPGLVSTYLSQRRGIRGYLAISRGLVSVGAGDRNAAIRYAGEAKRIARGEPLALLLEAQVAQLDGRREDAEAAFRAMAQREDTKLLGLRGLFIEARRREDLEAAHLYAETAAKASPSLGWAGQAVLDYRCAAGDWTGALDALDRNNRHSLVRRAEYKRQRAVLLTARAIAAEQEDRDRALPLALEAVKLAPDLVPAAELAGRLLGEKNELRKASRIIEAAWTANPHPDLAETYAHLRMGDSTRERLARVQRLADKAPAHPESALAVARAALDAQEFAAARAALRPLLREPTQRVALLMAEIETRESGDEGRAREWMARALRAARDPAWTADGFVSGKWLPVSPVSGRIDAFQWKVPLSELADQREVIDLAEDLPSAPQPAVIEAQLVEPPVEAPPEPAPVDVPPEPPKADAKPDPKPDPAPEPKSEAVSDAKPDPAPPMPTPGPAPAEPSRPAAAVSGAAPNSGPKSQPSRRIETVIPMTRAPDDPGPDAGLDVEPQPSARHRGPVGL